MEVDHFLAKLQGSGNAAKYSGALIFNSTDNSIRESTDGPHVIFGKILTTQVTTESFLAERYQQSGHQRIEDALVDQIHILADRTVVRDFALACDETLDLSNDFAFTHVGLPALGADLPQRRRLFD
jgi:hypothetical protein